jgi:hypothetical protein
VSSNIDYTRLISDQRIHLLTNKLRELSVANMPFSYQSPTTPWKGFRFL